MADVVRTLGRGGQRFAEKYLGWNRKTIRKGIQERESGQPLEDRFHERGRKKIEEHLPSLLEDIREIVEPRSQTDPTFRSTRVYTPRNGPGILDSAVSEISGGFQAASSGAAGSKYTASGVRLSRAL